MTKRVYSGDEIDAVRERIHKERFHEAFRKANAIQDFVIEDVYNFKKHLNALRRAFGGGAVPKAKTWTKDDIKRVKDIMKWIDENRKICNDVADFTLEQFENQVRVAKRG